MIGTCSFPIRVKKTYVRLMVSIDGGGNKVKLIGERIYLRYLKESDAPILLENKKDEEIRYMTGTRSTFTLEQLQLHIKNIHEDPSRHDLAIC